MRQFLVTSFQISVLLNPFAVLSTFFALTGEMSRGERANIMFRTCVTSMIAGLVVLFSGDFIFFVAGHQR